jgi:hypothetical protein
MPNHPEEAGDFSRVIARLPTLAEMRERPIQTVFNRPWRSEKYLAFVRLYPCIVAGCWRKAEAAHTETGEMHGMSQKTGDDTAVPICTEHHTMAPTAYHQIGEAEFCRLYDIDLVNVRAYLHADFRAIGGKLP